MRKFVIKPDKFAQAIGITSVEPFGQTWLDLAYLMALVTRVEWTHLLEA